MPNEKCLKGFHCPKCHAYDEFQIEITGWAKVVDSVIESTDDHAWTPESRIICSACLHEGTVREFTEASRVPAPKQVNVVLSEDTIAKLCKAALAGAATVLNEAEQKEFRQALEDFRSALQTSEEIYDA